MRTRTILEVAAIVAVPCIAGLLVLAAVINQAGEAIDQAHEYLRDELERLGL